MLWKLLDDSVCEPVKNASTPKPRIPRGRIASSAETTTARSFPSVSVLTKSHSRGPRSQPARRASGAPWPGAGHATSRPPRSPGHASRRPRTQSLASRSSVTRARSTRRRSRPGLRIVAVRDLPEGRRSPVDSARGDLSPSRSASRTPRSAGDAKHDEVWSEVPPACWRRHATSTLQGLLQPWMYRDRVLRTRSPEEARQKKRFASSRSAFASPWRPSS